MEYLSHSYHQQQQQQYEFYSMTADSDTNRINHEPVIRAINPSNIYFQPYQEDPNMHFHHHHPNLSYYNHFDAPPQQQQQQQMNVFRRPMQPMFAVPQLALHRHVSAPLSTKANKFRKGNGTNNNTNSSNNNKSKSTTKHTVETEFVQDENINIFNIPTPLQRSESVDDKTNKKVTCISKKKIITKKPSTQQANKESSGRLAGKKPTIINAALMSRLNTRDPLMGRMIQWFPSVIVEADESISVDNVNLEGIDALVKRIPMESTGETQMSMTEIMRGLVVQQEKTVCQEMSEKNPKDAIFAELTKMNPEYDLTGLSLEQLQDKLRLISDKFTQSHSAQSPTSTCQLIDSPSLLEQTYLTASPSTLQLPTQLKLTTNPLLLQNPQPTLFCTQLVEEIPLQQNIPTFNFNVTTFPEENYVSPQKNSLKSSNSSNIPSSDNLNQNNPLNKHLNNEGIQLHHSYPSQNQIVKQETAQHDLECKIIEEISFSSPFQLNSATQQQQQLQQSQHLGEDTIRTRTAQLSSARRSNNKRGPSAFRQSGSEFLDFIDDVDVDSIIRTDVVAQDYHSNDDHHHLLFKRNPCETRNSTSSKKGLSSNEKSSGSKYYDRVRNFIVDADDFEATFGMTTAFNHINASSNLLYGEPLPFSTTIPSFLTDIDDVHSFSQAQPFL